LAIALTTKLEEEVVEILRLLKTLIAKTLPPQSTPLQELGFPKFQEMGFSENEFLSKSGVWVVFFTWCTAHRSIPLLLHHHHYHRFYFPTKTKSDFSLFLSLTLSIFDVGNDEESKKKNEKICNGYIYNIKNKNKNKKQTKKQTEKEIERIESEREGENMLILTELCLSEKERVWRIWLCAASAYVSGAFYVYSTNVRRRVN
jgi:hypothetical protein